MPHSQLQALASETVDRLSAAIKGGASSGVGFAAFDLETNNTKGPEARKLHPAFGNKVVLGGIKQVGKPAELWHDNLAMPLPIPLTGHNLQYDYGYMGHQRFLRDGPSLLDHHLASAKPVWDTQVAEYVMGYRLKSLEKACEDRGVDFKKDDEIKEYWDRGVDTEDIPTNTLRDYLREDLRATAELQEKQSKVLKNSEGTRRLVVAMSMVARSLAKIEQTGMYVDSEVLMDYAESLDKKQAELETLIKENLRDRGAPEGLIEKFSFNSAANLDVLFRGGKYKFTTREVVGKYKNGKDKYGKVEREVWVTPPGGHEEAPEVPTTATGKPSFTDNWLKAAQHNETEVGLLAEVVQEVRGIAKEIGTFIAGVVRCTNTDTSLLHGDLNNCVTATGRLSSSNPNLQNITNKTDFKGAFTSRYGDNGTIVEIDYKQVEVIALAALSQCPALIAALSAGSDIHYETGKRVFGWTSQADVNDKQKRLVKGVNFGLIYGGGAPTISSQTGAPVELVEKIIEAFYSAFPGVRKWQKEMYALVKKRAFWGGAMDGAVSVQSSWLMSPLGRMFRYDQETPPWGGKPTFPPTKIKNHPVQGFATGDIVPLAVLLTTTFLARAQAQGDLKNVHTVNNVHDSIVFDIRNDQIGVVEQLVWLMEDGVAQLLKECWGVTLPVGLRAEPTFGPNWLEQKDYPVTRGK